MEVDATLPQQVLDWLGQVVIVQAADVTVEPGSWETFCVAVEDANLLYWDKAGAAALGPGLLAPPALMSAWTRPHPWSPAAQSEAVPRALELHHRLKELLGYPLGIVLDVESRFLLPLRPGDRVQAEQMLSHVGVEYSNRLGTGRDWSITVNYRRADGALVGQDVNRLFGYRRSESS